VSDAPFLTRQDLINYFAKIDTSINTSNATYSQALPYLGTFSRAVSAPSYFHRPIRARYPVIKPAWLRRTLLRLTIRVWKHRASPIAIWPTFASPILSRSPTTMMIKPERPPHGNRDLYRHQGDPLLQNRFSLARINWLSSKDIGGADAPGTTNPATGNGPSSAFATAIKACFGLQWGVVGTVANGGNPCWKYVGSPDSTGVSHFSGTIETLDQVAAEGREPNFFELLKAAILSGSLGLSPGPAGWENGLSDLTTSEMVRAPLIRIPLVPSLWTFIRLTGRL